MRVVSHRRLVEFYETTGREDSRAALEKWYATAKDAAWKGLADIRRNYPACDYVGNQHYVFNIRGNNYRLVVVIKFVMGYIYVRFVGTHSEYESIDASKI